MVEGMIENITRPTRAVLHIIRRLLEAGANYIPLAINHIPRPLSFPRRRPILTVCDEESLAAETGKGGRPVAIGVDDRLAKGKGDQGVSLGAIGGFPAGGAKDAIADVHGCASVA